MRDETPLDRAHAAMIADEGDDAARLRFYERVADAELFVLLERKAEGDHIEPDLFEIADARYLLAFDHEARLAGFVGKTAPYAALSGRALVRMLAGQGIGLALNPQAAPSSMLLPSEAVDWLADMLAHAPDEISALPVNLAPPADLPESMLLALDTKLTSAAGLARVAYLAAVTYQDGRPGHLLGFIDTVPGAEAALAKAVTEALSFSSVDAGEIDVGFFGSTDAIATSLARVGLRFDLPAPDHAPRTPTAPGRDPDKPPRLR